MDPWAATFGDLHFGGLRASDGSWFYRFRMRDLRWAIPMLAGEGRNHDDHVFELWAMANRLWSTRDVRIVRRDGYVLPSPHKFADLILAYSSVINPYFQEHGSWEAIAHRVELSTAPPSYFEPQTVELAVDFMTGALAPPPESVGIVHFAECEFGRGEHGEPAFEVSNCFWRDRTWPPGFQILPAPPERSSFLGPAALALAMAAVAGVALWRSR